MWCCDQQELRPRLKCICAADDITKLVLLTFTVTRRDIPPTKWRMYHRNDLTTPLCPGTRGRPRCHTSHPFSVYIETPKLLQLTLTPSPYFRSNQMKGTSASNPSDPLIYVLVVVPNLLQTLLHMLPMSYEHRSPHSYFLKPTTLVSSSHTHPSEDRPYDTSDPV